MGRCVAFNCNERGNYKFPKNAHMRRKWENALRKVNYESTEHSRLCRNHFTENDFEGVKKNGFTYQRRFLKACAIPSVFCWNQPSTSYTDSRTERLHKRNVKKFLMPIMDAPPVVQETKSPLECFGEGEIKIKSEPEDTHFISNVNMSTLHKAYNDEILPFEFIKLESNMYETDDLRIEHSPEVRHTPQQGRSVGGIHGHSGRPESVYTDTISNGNPSTAISNVAPSSETSDITSKSKVHNAKKLYRCQECDAKFSDSCKLKMHVLIHTGEKPYGCEECDARFTQSFNLKRHMLIHTGAKQYSCEECDAKFSDASGLKRHVLMHTGEKPHACETCGVKFSHSVNLKRHTLVHTRAKQYSCEECGAKFNCLSKLKRHILMHTGERLFSCRMCDAKFNQPYNLKRHILKHTGEKRFNCEICDAKFVEFSKLKRHIMSIHSAGKAYGCNVCNATFSHTSSLSRHIRSTHAGEEQCDT